MSQKARKNTARTAATRERLRDALSVVALNGPIQRAKPAWCALVRPNAEEAARGKSGHAYRWSGSAFEISIPVLRRSAELPCSTQKGKHRRVIERDGAPGAARLRIPAAMKRKNS
jgi:hypothetical protein